MQHFRKPDTSRFSPRKQHGGVLMVMLIIMIIGASAILVSSLNSSATKIARDKTTANALAQAREALIGYAVSDSNHPGELPCPDVDDDGKLTMNIDYVGSSCASPIGRLPWKTLGLQELRDGAGEHLWYTVSKTFIAIGSPNINSDTQGTLSISGTSSASNVIAIVFAPGAAIQGDNRSPSITAACLTSGTNVPQSLCAANYLEGSNAELSTWATPNLNYKSADAGSTFNDQMIFITHKDLMPLVEKRIAREVRRCLDNYASNNGYKYPWAAPVSSTTYTGVSNTLFGRLPASTSSYGPSDQLMLDDITALLNALDNYKAYPSDPNSRAAVDAAATTLYKAATNYNGTTLGSASINNTQLYAGRAQDASKNNQSTLPSAGSSAATVSTWVGDTTSGEKGDIYKQLLTNHYNKDGLYLGSSTTLIWPNCTLLTTPYTYWPDWRDLVFYQLASGYAPNGSASCGTSPNTCLTINGSGNTVSYYNGTYRAAVIVAGEMLSGQSPRTPATNPPNTYLANTTSEKSSDPAFVTNAHDSTSPTPDTTFITYKPSDPYYQNVNDLVLCLDGSVNCK